MSPPKKLKSRFQEEVINQKQMPFVPSKNVHNISLPERQEFREFMRNNPKWGVKLDRVKLSIVFLFQLLRNRWKVQQLINFFLFFWLDINLSYEQGIQHFVGFHWDNGPWNCEIKTLMSFFAMVVEW